MTGSARHLSSGVALDQRLGWRQTVAQQLLRAVKIGQNGVEQGRALVDCAFDQLPSV
ncbi:MAG TPA: hypothetical protein VKV17_16155 [Bryobacteraceae bacterium]|nr:hypothetical protein [Bryobacteraceae bacterium]